MMKFGNAKTIVSAALLCSLGSSFGTVPSPPACRQICRLIHLPAHRAKRRITVTGFLPDAWRGPSSPILLGTRRRRSNASSNALH